MKFFVFYCLLIFSINTKAAEVAVCSDPSGHAYYPEIGLIDKKSSGWQKDAISGGKITVTSDETGNIDLLFVDASQQINSSTQQGGQVSLISQGKRDFRVMVVYPTYGTVEIYSFWVNDRGQKEYSVLNSRTSDALFMKSSLMKGKCSFLNSGLFRSGK